MKIAINFLPTSSSASAAAISAAAISAAIIFGTRRLYIPKRSSPWPLNRWFDKPIIAVGEEPSLPC